MKNEKIHGAFRELCHVTSGARETTICTGLAVLLSDHTYLEQGGKAVMFLDLPCIGRIGCVKCIELQLAGKNWTLPPGRAFLGTALHSEVLRPWTPCIPVDYYMLYAI